MRSNPKATKPPPPVPPRPSKSMVAEALAKSRKPSGEPAAGRPVVKSQSYSAVNNYCRVVPKIERHTSLVDEAPEPHAPKPATRTLIYQSSNVQEIKQFKANDTVVRRTSSFKAEVKRNDCDNICKISLTTADKSVKLSRDSSLESLGESDECCSNELVSSIDSVISDNDSNWNEINDRNHVNTLIDEMFASVLDVPDDKLDNVQGVAQTEEQDNSKTTIVIEDNDSNKKVHFVQEDNKPTKTKTLSKIDDKQNHELLISELANMKREQERIRILRRQRKPSLELDDNIVNNNNNTTTNSKIQHSDWVEVNNGQEIRLSSCQIRIENDEERAIKEDQFCCSRFGEMSNLHGLPPLPKSLSGFNLIDGSGINSQQQQLPTPTILTRPGSSRSTSSSTYSTYGKSNGDVNSLKKGNNLDAKLALLRREMYSLRQLDLSLLSQLWSLNESIQDFRHILQEQDDRNVLSPPSPSPTPSSGEDGDGDEFFQPSPMRFRPAPPPPPHRRPSNSSSGTGSSV